MKKSTSALKKEEPKTEGKEEIEDEQEEEEENGEEDCQEEEEEYEDEEEEDISKCFDETFEWIEGQRERGNVLIHCHAGVSRSATVLIAYLMRKEGVGLKEADGMVRRRREIIRPNKGFVEQLKVYERRLGRREERDGLKKRNWVAPWERK